MISQSTTGMAKLSSLPRWNERSTPTDWPRIRFAAAVAVFAGFLGAATILVNFLAQIQFPDIPEHLPAFRSFVLSSAGALAGITLTGPLAYALYGSPPIFYPEQNKRTPRGLIIWFLVGYGYGVAFSLLLGGIFLPIALNILDVVGGLMSVTRMLSKSLDLFISAPTLAVVLGLRILITGVIGGVVFGGGAWLIDRFNASEDPATAKYGPIAISVVLSAGVVVFVVFVPAPFWAPFG